MGLRGPKKGSQKTEPGEFEYRAPRTAPRTASESLRDFFGRILAQESLTLSEVASRLSMTRISIQYWKSGARCPSVLTFEEALAELGYEIQIVRKVP